MSNIHVALRELQTWPFDLGLASQEITKFLISNLIIGPGRDHRLISQRIHLTCKLVGKHFIEKKKKNTVVSVWWLPASNCEIHFFKHTQTESELLFLRVIVECRKTSRGACITSHDSLVQHVLARVAFEPHVVSTFRHHLRVLLHPTDNIKLSNNRRQHKCIYIKHRSLVINATHCVVTGKNIREADVASLPRVTL